MSKKPLISAAEAAEMVKDGMTVTTGGFVASALPEALTRALEDRFLNTGAPRDLTLFFAAGQGNRDGSGTDHFAHEGMLRRVIGGHFNMAPELGKLITANKLEAYNLPQGTMCQMFRDIAAHKVGTLTHVGLNTFVDPRLEGGKLNAVTQANLVERVELLGRELLLYKVIPLDIALLRGTYADENGNVSLEHESSTTEATAMAQAVKNCGGKVIVQVERVVQAGALDPRLVKIPGAYVDAIVVSERAEDQVQYLGGRYDGSMTGDFRVPLGDLDQAPMSAKKIIGRRSALELKPGSIVNLGIGVPEYVSLVANEEGIGDFMTLTVEAGPIGGVPQGGPRFGGSVNVECVLDQPYQFDFYDGGGLDIAFLGLAQADKAGNINVSRFGSRIVGCGGFINITQNTKKVVFCGTFTAGGIKTHTEDGKLVIDCEGRQRKLVEAVDQITFSGVNAVKTGQTALYVTERAVFELRQDGLYLTEIAPGIDLQTQVLDYMSFRPGIDPEGPRLMDPRIFRDEPMGLAGSAG